MARNWASSWPWTLAVLGLWSAGPAPAAPPADPAPPAAKAWTLDGLIHLAAERNPALAIARARVEAAVGQMVQAGLYPNPVLSYNGEELADNHNAVGKQGAVLVQEIVTAKKLYWARAAAAYGVAVFDWQALTRWYEVVTRVRLAYFEVLTAQRNLDTQEDIVRLARQGLDAAQKLQKAGTGTLPDVLRAQVELDQALVQVGVARQRLDAAWKLLAVAVGVPCLPPAPLAGDLEAAAPVFDWKPVWEGVLFTSPVQEARAAVGQAERQYRRAKADAIPNVIVQVQPFHDFPDDDSRVNVRAGAALPLFNRNQGNIRSSQADLARTQEEVRQVELRLTEQLALAYQRYQAARQQAEAYRTQILPRASESLRLVRLGYESGDPKYDYTTVLQAQLILFQARLVYVQALGDLWRGVSEIAGLLQQDELADVGCPAVPGIPGERDAGQTAPSERWRANPSDPPSPGPAPHFQLP